MDLKRNAALQCVKFGDGDTDRQESWQQRFVNILNCVRDSYGKHPFDALEVASFSSCALSGEEDDISSDE